MLTKKQLEDFINCANIKCEDCSLKSSTISSCYIAVAETTLELMDKLEMLEGCDINDS